MADNIRQRIRELARQLYGDGVIEIVVEGNDADLYVDDVRRHMVHAYDGGPLDALERHLRANVDRARKGRS